MNDGLVTLLSLCPLLIPVNLPDTRNLDADVVLELFLQLRVVSEQSEEDFDVDEERGQEYSCCVCEDRHRQRKMRWSIRVRQGERTLN